MTALCLPWTIAGFSDKRRIELGEPRVRQMTGASLPHPDAQADLRRSPTRRTTSTRPVRSLLCVVEWRSRCLNSER